MKRLFGTIFFLIILSVLTQPANAALPAGLHWITRTDGASDNGGCYDIANDGGTDYSNQTSAQLDLTDLATTGAVTTLTSATGGFTSAMVDNCIYIDGGTNFDVGYYEITAYTDTNTVTLDRTPSSGGAGSSGTGKVGGAIDHPDRVVPDLVGGNTVYIKAGTYARLGSNAYVLDTSDSNGNDQSTPIIYEGFNSTLGDTPTGASRPVLDCADTATNGILSDGGDNILVKNLIVQDCTGTGVYSDNLYLWNVRSTSNTGPGFGEENTTCVFCEADNNGDAGIQTNNSNRTFWIFYSYIHDNTGTGVYLNYAGGGGGFLIIGSVVDSNGGGLVNRSDYGLFAINNVVYNNTGDGLDNQQGGEVAEWPWIGNITHSNTGYGMSLSSSTREAPFFVGYNINYNNTSGAIDSTINTDLLQGNLTSDPAFTNAASGDFTVGSSSPALDAFFDFTEVGLTGAYKINIGLDQDDNAAGGGGGESSYTYVQ